VSVAIFLFGQSIIIDIDIYETNTLQLKFCHENCECHCFGRLVGVRVLRRFVGVRVDGICAEQNFTALKATESLVGGLWALK